MSFLRTLANHKDDLSLIKDVLTILGVVVAVWLYYFKIVIQRQYQRLSTRLDLQPLEVRDGIVVAQISLTVTNEAECRINLLNPRFSIRACEPYREDSNSNLPKDKSFEKNLGTLRRSREESSSEKRAALDRYSVDAKSDVTFTALAEIPGPIKLVAIEGQFGPDLTHEIYKVSRFFKIVFPSSPVAN